MTLTRDSDFISSPLSSCSCTFGPPTATSTTMTTSFAVVTRYRTSNQPLLVSQRKLCDQSSTSSYRASKRMITSRCVSRATRESQEAWTNESLMYVHCVRPSQAFEAEMQGFFLLFNRYLTEKVKKTAMWVTNTILRARSILTSIIYQRMGQDQPTTRRTGSRLQQYSQEHRSKNPGQACST